MLLRSFWILALATSLTACAVDMRTEPATGRPQLAMQNPALNPGNGGLSVDTLTIERRVCELPVVPPLVRDFCVQGVAAVQLGIGRNDQFFCSQFVLEAYRQAGLPLTDADPRLFSPGDLLHMREGDVLSVRIHHTLQYVGHLKFQPAAAVATNH